MDTCKLISALSLGGVRASNGYGRRMGSLSLEEGTARFSPGNVRENGSDFTDNGVEEVLGVLREKSSGIERFVYLVGIFQTNENLFLKVLMSRSIRFLLASNSRRSLLEIAGFTTKAENRIFERLAL